LLSQVSKNIEFLAVGQHDVHDDQLEIPRKRRARLALQCAPQKTRSLPSPGTARSGGISPVHYPPPAGVASMRLRRVLNPRASPFTPNPALRPSYCVFQSSRRRHTNPDDPPLGLAAVGGAKCSARSMPVTSSWHQIGLAKGGVKRRRRSRRSQPRRPSKSHSRSCQLIPSRDRQERSLERKWMHDRRRIAARTGEIQQVAVTPRVYPRNLWKPFGTSRLAKTAGYANWR
jgi:hypothetical protein